MPARPSESPVTRPAQTQASTSGATRIVSNTTAFIGVMAIIASLSFGVGSMGFLAGKRILITGLLSNRSIAYGIAKAMHREGAELAFTYQNERFQERVAKMAADFGSSLLFPLDVQDDAQILDLFRLLGEHWVGLDGLVPPSPSLRARPWKATSSTASRARHSASRRKSAPTASRRWRGRAPDDEGPQRRTADLVLPGRRAHNAQLQHHGPRRRVSKPRCATWP